MAIIGILAWAFLPNLIGGQEEGLRVETQTRLTTLRTAADSFEIERRVYPADNFRDPELELKAKADNGVNTGIESLVVLTQSVQGTTRLEDEAMMANTDGDQNGAEIQYLGRSDRPEVVDGWGSPFAYFSSWNDGYERGAADPNARRRDRARQSVED